MKIETTSEKVLVLATEKPELKEALMVVFPTVFENEMPFCKIGSIFLRKDYPSCVYAVIKSVDEVVILNIVHSTTWAVKEKIKLSSLSDVTQKSISVGEFRRLTGYRDLYNFVPIDTADLKPFRM